MNEASNPAIARPVYLPLTFLPPAVLAALQHIFRSVAVVWSGPVVLPEPMQPFAASGFLHVLRPADSDGGEAVLREIQRWAQRHHGGLGAAAAWRQERFAADALGTDGTPFEIAAAIRRGPAVGGGVLVDPLHAAALFLRLAQDADWQQHQVDRALSECSRRHGRLFDAVSGKARPAAEDDPLPVAAVSHLPERMAAWVRVFRATGCPSPVFVTHHAEAVEWLRERSPGALRIALEALPGMLPGPNPAGSLPRGDVAALLATFARSPLTSMADGHRGEARLPAVHIWAETPPDVFLARIAAIDVKSACNEGETARHTLVVQMPVARL